MTIPPATASQTRPHLITPSSRIPLIALGVLVYILTMAAWAASLPSDGWLIEQDPESRRVTFTYKLTDAPSPLQMGDELLAAEGYTIAQIDAAIYTLNPPHSDNWREGGAAQYTILREGRELTLAVPLRRLTLAEIARQFAPSGLADLPLIGFLLVGVIALAVFIKQPRHLAAQLLLLVGAGLTGIAVGFFSVGIAINFTHYPLLSGLINPWPLFVHAPLVHLLLVFPMQKRIVRLHPRLILSLVYFTVPLASVLAIIWMSTYAPGQIAILEILGGLIIFLFPLAVMLPSLAHTFRAVREPVARAQAKWVGAGIVGLIVLTNIGWIVPTAGGSEWFWLINVAGYAQLPICLGVAILRYRLWDIDLIIRRTLTYSILSSLLGLTYFGSVVVLQSIFTAVTGQSSAAIIVLSTLAIAALFFPLRNRVQDFIDRRFFRKKYDAAKVIADFAATCRDETDLDKLTARLVEVVQETMQPESVGLWLKDFNARPQRGKGARE